MAEENQEIDNRAWVLSILKNWYKKVANSN